MATVLPRGINIKDNDISVEDGFLWESINLQRRDGSLRPIPERIISDIDVVQDAGTYSNIFFHKVADEDQINVLGFLDGVSLEWFGIITDGVFASIDPGIDLVGFPTVVDIDSYSITILNGFVYLMSADEEVFYQLQYDVNIDEYRVKNMYDWKDVSFKLEQEADLDFTIPGSYAYVASSIVGCILIRFAFVLKTGEVVKHSAMFPYDLQGLNFGSSMVANGDPIQNIYTFVPFNLSIFNQLIYDEEISGINIYASTPQYNTEFSNFQAYAGAYSYIYDYSGTQFKGAIEDMSKSNFYLVKTITEPDVTKGMILYAGSLSGEIIFDTDRVVSKINLDTIAAGEVMPVDNFTHHRLYGDLSAYNGTLIIKNPKTILSNGYIENFTLRNTTLIPPSIGLYYQGFDFESEDGKLEGGMAEGEDYVYFSEGGFERIFSEAVLSYPDSRANKLLLGNGAGNTVSKPLQGVISNYLSCSFDIYAFGNDGAAPLSKPGTDHEGAVNCKVRLIYEKTDTSRDNNGAVYYTSENRAQFSESGEYSVFPAERSYRIGEGKIVAIGTNSVDPANADVVAPLIIGTTDGVYTINLDPTGENFIASTPKTANMPCLSSEILQIDQNILFVSDKGLIAINNGRIINLTEAFFPDQGDGEFPTQNTVLPNYNLLTTDFLGGSGNPYIFEDIVTYLKGALMAYDGRRGNVWLSNPNKNYSLVYNLALKQWGMSTFVFNYRTELFSTLDTLSGDIYSRFLVMKSGSDNVYILSGEDLDTEVDVHLLSRPIKLGAPKLYKKIESMAATCELFRSSASGYFYFGAWGKQDMNKNKEYIPIVAISDDTAGSFPGDVRENIPLGMTKGKYKAITMMLGGKMLPKSSIDNFEYIAFEVNELKIR